VNIVIHAAALKQVPTAEYNPIEVIKTNVLGGANIIDAAIDRNVEKVLALSTDKAANPINLYGATKLCSDKLFVAANGYSGHHATRFSVVRYGNVMGSRGSVIPFFQQMRGTGALPVTDPNMTRFWITLDQGVRFVISCIERMHGGEVFIPKLPSMNMMDFARAVAPDCEIEVIGIRPGEKLHESMITEDEARQAVELHDRYVIQPAHSWWSDRCLPGRPLPDGFSYSSNTNTHWLSETDLMEMISA
jgi:UDP-N-acetylglucosamine 4,6-dehydratase